MKVGVNYTPRQGWFHSWLDFDAGSIRADLTAIAELGLDHVRIFPLWPVLQPDRAVIRRRALDDVATVVEIAGSVGLDVHIDALNGHLSSFDFLPAWVTTWHQRNLFADPEARSAEVELVRALADRLRDLPAARGLGLGNEFSQFAAPRHPHAARVDPGQVDTWLRELLGAAEDAWPAGEHTHSYDDDLWFVDAHPFLPRHAVDHGASTTVHSWMFGKDWGRDAGDVDAYAWFARYLLELASGWSAQPGRALWLQEIGAPSSHVPPDEASRFLRDSLLRCVDMPGLQAMTWWCSHDVSRSLPDFPELEYTLGLFDSDGALKPAGEELREILPDLRGSSSGTGTSTPSPGESSPSPGNSSTGADRPFLEFDVAPDGLRRSLTAPGHDVFRQWLAQARTGQVPALRPVREEGGLGNETLNRYSDGDHTAVAR